MTIVTQILLGLIFLLLSLLSFTFVGLVILKKIRLDLEGIEKFVLSSALGLVLFTLSAYILAALNLRFLMWTFPIVGFYVLIRLRKKVKFGIANLLKKRLLLIVLILGVIGQVAVNAPSGFPYKGGIYFERSEKQTCPTPFWCGIPPENSGGGIYFYSSHGHDGVWHLALMQEMQKNQFPFQNPELAGFKLQNYHFFADLLMSEFSRLFHFSLLDIYFRFMPMVFSILLGLSSYIFVKSWSKSDSAGIWAMFFTYFAGSFGYLLYIPTHKSLGGESIFWVSQTQSVLGNPPHAAAFIILTTFLFCLLKYLNNRQFGYFLLCVILGGSVVEFKVYAGVLLLGGLLILGLYDLLKKSYQTLILFLITLFISLLVYLPNSANSQDFLLWQPWWYIRTMVVATDRLNWLDMELRRQTYIAENNWKRVIQIEVTAFFIFLIGNLGMRILGFWTIYKQAKENIFKYPFNLFFLSITTASFFIPVFFLQKGVAWNSIQFNQYFLLLFGFLAASSLAQILKLFKAKYLKLLVSLIIIILAVPTQLGLLLQFYSNKPLSKISYQEISALNYLKDHGTDEDIILVAPFNKYERDKYKNPPIPIYAWYDTGYVSAFSRKQTLISDEEQLTIMGYDISKLIKERQDVFEVSDAEIINNFFKKHKINYVYLAWNQKFAASSSAINADLLYENKDAKILKVRQ